MSSKSPTKRSPRAMPMETIITRYKSAQRQLQQANELKKRTKLKTYKNNKKSSSHGIVKKILPMKQLIDEKRNAKKIENEIKEFYPDKLKRTALNKKVTLHPKHCLKVIGGTKSSNKRKLHIPQKDVKRTRYRSNCSSPSDLDTKSPKHTTSTELTIKDMVLLIEEKGGLDGEDLLEILTCPSPVWWEDPPTGYIEDPIFARPKPEEQMSIKKQLLEEQKKEAERRKLKEEKESLSLNSGPLPDIDKLGVSKIDINIENRGTNFISKRCKLESLLGSIKNKAKKVNDTNKKQKENTNKKLNAQFEPKNIENNDNDTNHENIHIFDTDTSNNSREKRNSDSFEDDHILDLDDDEIFSLENMVIPIAPNNTAEKIEILPDENRGCVKEENVNTTKNISPKMKDNLLSNPLRGIKVLTNKSATNEVKTNKSKHKVLKKEIDSSFSKTKHTNVKYVKQVDAPSNTINRTLPRIRVKKIETLKNFANTNDNTREILSKTFDHTTKVKREINTFAKKVATNTSSTGIENNVTNVRLHDNSIKADYGSKFLKTNNKFTKIDDNVTTDIQRDEFDVNNERTINKIETIEVEDEILSINVSELNSALKKSDDLTIDNNELNKIDIMSVQNESNASNDLLCEIGVEGVNKTTMDLIQHLNNVCKNITVPKRNSDEPDRPRKIQAVNVKQESEESETINHLIDSDVSPKKNSAELEDSDSKNQDIDATMDLIQQLNNLSKSLNVTEKNSQDLDGNDCPSKIQAVDVKRDPESKIKNYTIKSENVNAKKNYAELEKSDYQNKNFSSRKDSEGLEGKNRLNEKESDCPNKKAKRDSEVKSSETKHKGHKKETDSSCSRTKQTNSIDSLKQVDAPSNKIKHIPHIRVKKIKTLKHFANTNDNGRKILSETVDHTSKHKGKINTFMNKVATDTSSAKTENKAIHNDNSIKAFDDTFAKVDDSAAIGIQIDECDVSNEITDLNKIETIEVEDEILSNVSELNSSLKKSDDLTSDNNDVNKIDTSSVQNDSNASSDLSCEVVNTSSHSKESKCQRKDSIEFDKDRPNKNEDVDKSTMDLIQHLKNLCENLTVTKINSEECDGIDRPSKNQAVHVKDESEEFEIKNCLIENEDVKAKNISDEIEDSDYPNKNKHFDLKKDSEGLERNNCLNNEDDCLSKKAKKDSQEVDKNYYFNENQIINGKKDSVETEESDCPNIIQTTRNDLTQYEEHDCYNKKLTLHEVSNSIGSDENLSESLTVNTRDAVKSTEIDHSNENEAFNPGKDSMESQKTDHTNKDSVVSEKNEPGSSQFVNARRYSIESAESERNMSEEYLDMSLFDEDDHKIESTNDNNEIKDIYNCDVFEADTLDIKNAKSKLDMYENMNKSVNNEINKGITDNNEILTSCDNELSQENLATDTDNKESTEYVAVYKIITSDSENELNIAKHNEIKDIVTSTCNKGDNLDVTQTSAKVNRHINFYYKQRRRNRKNKSDKVNKGKVFSDTVVKKDCVLCTFKDKSIVISDSDPVKYCLLCSSIFDTDCCKYCIDKLKKNCTCEISEYQCDLCKIKVSSRKDMIEHFNNGNCSVRIS